MGEPEPDKKKKSGNPRTSQGSLRLDFEHANLLDMLWMALGTIGSVADGSDVSTNVLVFSSLINSYSRGASAITTVT